MWSQTLMNKGGNKGIRAATGCESNDDEGHTLLWHVDSGFPKNPFDGCLKLRGWCADACDPIKEVRIVIPGLMTWPGTYGLPRPDVHAAFPQSTTIECGFEICLKLPIGSYFAKIDLERMSGRVKTLSASHLRVSLLKRIGLLWGPPEKLLRFQMLVGPSRPPRATQNLDVKPPFIRISRDQWPSFSIVTPTYNQGPYLEETMRSVLKQESVRLHYVVQDGGSADGSQATIQRCVQEMTTAQQKSLENPSDGPANELSQIDLSPSRQSRLQVEWESSPDGGQTAALAKAFAKTRGRPDDLMAWINSDDFYNPGALAYVASYFAKHPQVDAIYSHRVLVDEKSQEIGRWYMPAHDDEVLQLYDFVPQETLFWRRRLWDRVAGLDPQFKFAMDWDLLLRFSRAKANVVRVPQFLACFRVHRAQKTANQILSIGQEEIEYLRCRANGAVITAAQLERDPRLTAYLRRSLVIEACWSKGIKA